MPKKSQGSRYCCGEHGGLDFRAASNAEGSTFSKIGTPRKLKD